MDGLPSEGFLRNNLKLLSHPDKILKYLDRNYDLSYKLKDFNDNKIHIQFISKYM